MNYEAKLIKRLKNWHIIFFFYGYQQRTWIFFLTNICHFPMDMHTHWWNYTCGRTIMWNTPYFIMLSPNVKYNMSSNDQRSTQLFNHLKSLVLKLPQNVSVLTIRHKSIAKSGNISKIMSKLIWKEQTISDLEGTKSFQMLYKLLWVYNKFEHQTYSKFWTKSS